MVYDDIIVGSGLTALATAYGLPAERRVLVIASPLKDGVVHYDNLSKIPCQNISFGGLGNYWHGVIPMHTSDLFADVPNAEFEELFQTFYPEVSVSERINENWLFVPFKPIRPIDHWKKLAEERSRHFTIVYENAETVSPDGAGWVVSTMTENKYSGSRLWIAAGALGTPMLLENSPVFQHTVSDTVSDHLILYAGQLRKEVHRHFRAPQTERARQGYWLKSCSDITSSGLITTKPARFNYRVLDQGIEQRSAFGLPTSGVIKKLICAGSLGFIAESVFNKLGLFPSADVLSVYAQIRLEDGYVRSRDVKGLILDDDKVTETIMSFRDSLNHNDLILSNRPDLYIKGIHLHGSLNNEMLADLGVNEKESNCFIVDASAVNDIGAEHHSFRLMSRAYHNAKSS